jgi:hypothetical protein
VQIGIHRSGRVARVRFGGAHPLSLRTDDKRTRQPGLVESQATSGGLDGSSLRELPAGEGFVFAAKVDSSRYKQRFLREFPRGFADRSGVMYMLPMSTKAGAAAGVVEPLFVFSYSERFGEDASRRQYVGFSLRDDSAKPVDLSEAPNPQATGDVRK